MVVVVTEQGQSISTMMGPVELTLAESVLLLALDEVKGSAGSTPLDPGLAGALLVDLGRLGALQPVGKQLHPVAVIVPVVTGGDGGGG